MIWEGHATGIFKVVADIMSQEPKKIEATLIELVGIDGILRTDFGFKIAKTVLGGSAMELNYSILSALRKVEIGVSMRAEWTHDGTTERFVDYAPSAILKDKHGGGTQTG
jgi:hypothetical protein